MDTPPQELLGDYLKRERESRLISMAAVSRALKDDASWIRPLENNDFNAFPNKKDIPAVLRRYAKFLLLNADDVVRRYEAQQGAVYPGKPIADLPSDVPGPSPLPTVAVTKYRDVKKAETPKPFRKGFWLAAFGVLIAIQLILLGSYVFFYRASVEGRKDGLRQMEQSTESRTKTPPTTLVRVIGNRDSRCYYLPGMKGYHAVAARHRVGFSSEEEAIAAGYRKAP